MNPRNKTEFSQTSSYKLFPVSKRLAAAFFIILILAILSFLHWILASKTLARFSNGEIPASEIAFIMKRHEFFAQAHLLGIAALGVVFFRSVYWALRKQNREWREESEKQREASEKSRQTQQALISILEDVQKTEDRLRHTAEELQAANEKLNELDKLKSDFVMMASHELKTPLAAIKAYVHLLLQEKVGNINDKQKEFLGHIGHAAERLHRLVLDLLDLSKIESGQMDFEPRMLNLETILKEEVETFRAEAGERQVELQLNVSKDLPEINADLAKIEEIIDNLVSNALKYTPKGGRVTVTAGLEEGNSQSVQIRVRDTGQGIPPGLEQKIFEPFYRGPKDREPEGESVGLGLALVKMLVEMHRGTIRVESQHQAGSVFIVTLPRN